MTGYAKGNARKDAIVDVATAFFGRVGYRSATMVQVAAACGISRAGLLHHFPTKESLLEAVLARRDQHDHDAFRTPRTTNEDGLSALVELVALVRHNATIPAIVNLYAVLSAEAGDPTHPAHGYFVRRYETSRAGLERAFTRLQDHGLLVSGQDPHGLAIEIVALMDGLQVQWLLTPDSIDMAARLHRRLDAVLTVPLPLTAAFETAAATAPAAPGHERSAS